MQQIYVKETSLKNNSKWQFRILDIEHLQQKTINLQRNGKDRGKQFRFQDDCTVGRLNIWEETNATCLQFCLATFRLIRIWLQLKKNLHPCLQTERRQVEAFLPLATAFSSKLFLCPEAYFGMTYSDFLQFPIQNFIFRRCHILKAELGQKL